MTTHSLAASALAIRELELEEDAANKLATASAEVLKFYDVPEAAPKTIAWVNLAQVVAFVYGARLFAYKARKAEEAAKRKAAQFQATPSPANGAAQPGVQPTPQPRRPDNPMSGVDVGPIPKFN